MSRSRVFALTFSTAAAVAGFTLSRAVPLAQIPNQAQMTAQTLGDVRFSTLKGFSIERVNPPERADSYVMLTFDSTGRLVVSKENDHPRALLDTDNDGIFEAEQVISDKVRNCQGLWFDGTTLYGACNEVRPDDPPAPQPGQGGQQRQQQSGIFKMQDTNGDGVTDTFEMVSRTAGPIQEHGPHAIRRAPDGGMTTLMGNFSTPVDEKLDPNSLVRNDKDVQLIPSIPNWLNSHREGIHSALYRWLPDRQTFTVEFGGNRNAYDYAYNLAGEAFLFDSDMEWDINMPWYREVRSVHGVLGGNYGYRNASGKYPPYYIDSLPPMRDVGRGSPVGVEFYTSYAYPREFFDNYFEADWSRGRLLYTALTPSGATYSTRSDRAEFVHGEPFNITDVEVGPDGMMYFTTGGRNTTGGVWRLRYTGTDVKPPDMAGILAVVRQPQPLSSWGWAAIENVKASMGAAFATELQRLARSASADAVDRVRAVLELQRHGPAPDAAFLKALAADANADVRAAAILVAAFHGREAAPIAAAALKDKHPLVRRRAAEALVRMGQSAAAPSLAPAADIYALLNDSDRFVRWAGRIAIERTPRAEWKDKVLAETNPLGLFEGMLAFLRTAQGDDLQPLIERQLAWMQRPSLSLENKLRVYRTFMYTAHEIKGGLSPAQREKLHTILIDQFPAKDERQNKELALMLAYAGQPQAISEILAAMPQGDANQPLQIHYLYALRVFTDGWTTAQKLQVADALGRAANWRGGAQFMNFVASIYEAVEGLYTSEEEEAALHAKAPAFAPLTIEELEEIRARQAASGRGGGRGGQQPAVVARRQGRILSRQEMLEEAVYQPQQKLDRADGRQLFEKHCASCHRFGALGNDHGVPGLDLTTSPMLASKYALLEAIMFPDRKVAPGHETTAFEMADGKTIHALVLKETPPGAAVLTREGTTTELQKGQVKARRKVKTSLMTEAMADAMNQSQWRNLLAFLTAAPPSGTTAAK